MKAYDTDFPLTATDTRRQKAVPMRDVVECFRFGEGGRTFYHFLERTKEGSVQNTYVVNYQPACNIATEIITEEDFKMARVQMVVASVQPDKDKELYEYLLKLKETHPEYFISTPEYKAAQLAKDAAAE